MTCFRLRTTTRYANKHSSARLFCTSTRATCTNRRATYLSTRPTSKKSCNCSSGPPLRKKEPHHTANIAVVHSLPEQHSIGIGVTCPHPTQVSTARLARRQPLAEPNRPPVRPARPQWIASTAIVRSLRQELFISTGATCLRTRPPLPVRHARWLLRLAARSSTKTLCPSQL